MTRTLLPSIRELSPRTATILAATALSQVFLITAYGALDQAAFIRLVRDVGLVGIGFAFVYKEIIWMIQALTSNKNDFDRFWLWHTQAIALLFLYSLILNFTSQQFAIRHYAVYTWIWFELWFQIMLSGTFVLYYAITQRVLPALRSCREGDKLCTFRSLRHHLGRRE